MKTHLLGFPRLGADRALKTATESFWAGKSSSAELDAAAHAIRLANWQTQRNAGLSYVSTGDFSFYDHVLDTCIMLQAIPRRFRHLPEEDLTRYFAMARGYQPENLPAMEMTKFFNTNYHYIVPEIEPDYVPKAGYSSVLAQTTEAFKSGFNPKPTLLGPITFLSLAKGIDNCKVWEKCEAVGEVYAQLIQELSLFCEWIELDEPILAGDISPEARAAFARIYPKLNRAAGPAKIMLAAYFDTIDDALDDVLASGCAGLHLDLIRGKTHLDPRLKTCPKTMTLSLGIVDGRNIWKNDFARSLACIGEIRTQFPNPVMLSASNSLLHTPLDLDAETALDTELKDYLAFAVQKCREIKTLADLADGLSVHNALEENQRAIHARKNSKRIFNAEVQTRLRNVSESDYHRHAPYSVRKKLQQARLNLPLFPTTTIGSFPQTPEIRRMRRAFKSGTLDHAAYTDFLKGEIRKTVAFQDEIGLDVAVHGEAERNDMVEYFGEQLSGFCFTQNGWVQSYGTRCVKPQIIFGDVSRPHPMTLEWITYAQSLTQTPMKGMLTGPVTILCWSFVRDDISRSEVCRQIALTIRDEVCDLEKAGIEVIQIDEAALREGMPVKKRNCAAYLKWAVESFRLATSGVTDSTQIHTHMCYSEFNTIIEAIADMDADVISIESSRSNMQLLGAFNAFNYPNEIGPGVYDIHSPRIPSEAEMFTLLQKALAVIPADRLWVNPDCGLKTRTWHEVIPALKNMVAAAKDLRRKNG